VAQARCRIRTAAAAPGHERQIGDLSDAAFATIAHERPNALVVGPIGFFSRRRVQLVTLATRDRLPTANYDRAFVEVDGLMSDNADIADSCRQVGVYTGNILKGAKPADLPVQQSTKFMALSADDIAGVSGTLIASMRFLQWCSWNALFLEG
jgi:ABC-type uncharacterized transport system substrate-binding protein